MTRVRDILDDLCRLAPLELQMGFDNAGLLVGSRDAEVKKVLLALDATAEVIAEGRERGVQLLVTHHPLIWTAMKSVTDGDIQARKVMQLLENRMALISMHTNLDIADGGVNDALAELLGASVAEPLDEDGCGRVTELSEEMDLHAFLPYCRDALGTNGLRYYDAGRPVRRLAVMGGAGGGAVEAAFRKGCDTYLTADIKYDQFLLARELGINLIDGDHFSTENPVMTVLLRRLSAAFPEVEFILSQKHCQTAAFFV